MKVAEINAGFDPKRDQTVDPVLWEIRRERMVELMGEGFWDSTMCVVGKRHLGLSIRYSTVNGLLKSRLATPDSLLILKKDTPIRQERKKVLSICIMILW